MAGIELENEKELISTKVPQKSEYQKKHFEFYFNVADSLNGINIETNKIKFKHMDIEDVIKKARSFTDM